MKGVSTPHLRQKGCGERRSNITVHEERQSLGDFLGTVIVLQGGRSHQWGRKNSVTAYLAGKRTLEDAMEKVGRSYEVSGRGTKEGLSPNRKTITGAMKTQRTKKVEWKSFDANMGTSKTKS